MHTQLLRRAPVIVRDFSSIRNEQAHAKFALPDVCQKDFV